MSEEKISYEPSPEDIKRYIKRAIPLIIIWGLYFSFDYLVSDLPFFTPSEAEALIIGKWLTFTVFYVLFFFVMISVISTISDVSIFGVFAVIFFTVGLIIIAYFHHDPEFSVSLGREIYEAAFSFAFLIFPVGLTLIYYRKKAFAIYPRKIAREIIRTDEEIKNRLGKVKIKRSRLSIKKEILFQPADDFRVIFICKYRLVGEKTNATVRIFLAFKKMNKENPEWPSLIKDKIEFLPYK